MQAPVVKAKPAYAIRQFHPDDVDDVLELYEAVYGVRKGRDWFDWKYTNNPYIDHVPMMVTEHAGRLVGARPCFALEMSVNGRRRLALQPGDAIVHPDHRRRGLFTRMTERLVDRYEGSDVAFFFNFPNRVSAKANLQLGWRQLPDYPTYYRIEDAGALVGSSGNGGTGAIQRSAIDALFSSYNRLCEQFVSPTTAVEVRRSDTIPAARLAALYRRHTPSEIHAVRDESFYDWRFANPDWTYETYVADDSLAMVVGTKRSAGVSTTRITDVVPLTDDSLEAETLELLRAVLTDHSDSAVLAAPPVPQLRRPLARLGFRKDTELPLRYMANPTKVVVRTLTGAWTVDGLAIDDPDNWLWTFAEQDTS